MATPDHSSSSSSSELGKPLSSPHVRPSCVTHETIPPFANPRTKGSPSSSAACRPAGPYIAGLRIAVAPRSSARCRCVAARASCHDKGFDPPFGGCGGGGGRRRNRCRAEGGAVGGGGGVTFRKTAAAGWRSRCRWSAAGNGGGSGKGSGLTSPSPLLLPLPLLLLHTNAEGSKAPPTRLAVGSGPYAGPVGAGGPSCSELLSLLTNASESKPVCTRLDTD